MMQKKHEMPTRKHMRTINGREQTHVMQKNHQWRHEERDMPQKNHP